MIYSPLMECMPLEQLRKLQNIRFRELVNYQYQRQDFYTKKFNEAGIDPKSIKGIEDIVRFPFTKKTDLRDHYPFGLLAVPEEELIRIHASSGTTGKPTIVGYTQGDIDIFSEVVARSLACAGGYPGMKLQNAYGYGLFTGGLGLHYGAEKLGMAVIPVSGGMTDRQLLLLQDLHAEMISCTPSYALTIAEEIKKRNIHIENLNLKFAVLGAEPWTEAIRKEVENGLNVVATNIYGLSEIMGPGVSQEDYEEKNGSHIWEDHFYPEIVDKETGEQLPEGKDGVLVITTLTKTAMPLMRYWTNDICSLNYDRDSKRTHIKMSPIRGRADDMLIIRGVNLFHTQVEAVLHELPEFSPHYQLVVTRDGMMDAVLVRTELGKKFSDLGENDDFYKKLQYSLIKKLKDNIGITMEVSIESNGAVPRSEGGKLSRIIDKRKIN
jgi:phenylacetate-CoA ligase